jgi:hypothetical protein
VLAVLSINSRVLEGLTCNLYLVYIYVKEQKSVCRSFTKILPISTWYTEPAAAASVTERRAGARLRAGDLWRQEVRRRGRRAAARLCAGAGGVQRSEVQRSRSGVGSARRSKAQWSGTGKQGEAHEEPALRVVN